MSLSAIVIVRYDSPGDENGKKYRSQLDLTLTLDDARQRLTKDGIIQAKELFEDKDGAVFPINSESSVKITDAIEVSNRFYL
jgi:hypothetical protein